MRTAEITRTTKETDIRLTLELDGSSKVSVDTGIGFADHMLTLFGFWSGMDLSLVCKGDLEIDAHHSLEDIGLVLGEALSKALGDKRGIQRVASQKVPMDEALAEVVVDLSGRPYFVYRGDDLIPATIAGDEKDVWREFFKSLAYKAGMNLHITYEYGLNGHHLLEAAFKALGLAMRQAAAVVHDEVSSTKGSLD